MGHDSRTVPIDAPMTTYCRSMTHRDKTRRLPRDAELWTMVTGRLRLMGWEDPTDEADDLDWWGRESLLSILTP
jgi:hypothetical protein